jgi:uridine kinase
MRVTGSTKRNNFFILGVAGGSGSGKTFFAQDVQRQLGPEVCEIIYQDNFYFDQSARFDFDGGSVNFDHPDSIDFDLLANCLARLKAGQQAQIPIYDFVTHSRKKETIAVKPKQVIVVDGILIFHAPQVRALFDDLVFFDTPEELRFARRMERDVKERGRTPQGVRDQFLLQVKPMHDQFVQPSMAYANTVMRDMGNYEKVLKEYCQRLTNIFSHR